MSSPTTSIADTVNSWFAQRLACGALARDTEAYNQAHAALPDLIARLDPEYEPAAALADPAPEADPESSAAN